MRKRVFLMAAALAAGAAGLTGCSSGSSGNSSADVGPLDQYWQALDSGQEWNEDNFAERDKKTQELIAECMAKEGFEYTPQISGGVQYVSADDEDGPTWGSLEFAEQYGYGAVAWPGMEDYESDSGNEYSDPNEPYINSLSESEQAAYWETLYGLQDASEDVFEQDEDGVENYEYRWEDNGCWGWADHQLNQDEDAIFGLWEDPEFEDMIQAMTEMSMSVYENSPELTELDKEWAACMADVGYPDLTGRSDAQEKVFSDYSDLFMGDNSEWVEPSQETIDTFQKAGIEAAVADWKCADKIGYDKQLQDLEFKAQEKFVEEYKDALEAMVAKYGQSDGS